MSKVSWTERHRERLRNTVVVQIDPPLASLSNIIQTGQPIRKGGPALKSSLISYTDGRTCYLYVASINRTSYSRLLRMQSPPPLSVWPHLFHGAGHEKRRGEQLKWFLAFRLYIGSFPCAQLPGPVHTARLGRVFLCI